jgi:hypothetical protein
MSFCTQSAGVALLALLAVACGDGGGSGGDSDSDSETTEDSAEAGEDEDAEEHGGHDRRDASAQSEDAASDEDAATRTRDAGTGSSAMDAASGSADASVTGGDSSQTAADGGACAEPPVVVGPVSDAHAEDVPPDAALGQDPGVHCHSFDFDPGLKLVKAQLVSKLGAPPAGGTVMPGTYDLEAEYRYVTEHASAQDRINCESYDGAYWERLVITGSSWQVLNRYDDHVVGRLSYTFQTSGTRLMRSQTCPALAPGMFDKGSVPFTATPGELHVFDAVVDPSQPCSPSVCEYEYISTRKS